MTSLLILPPMKAIPGAIAVVLGCVVVSLLAGCFAIIEQIDDSEGSYQPSAEFYCRAIKWNVTKVKDQLACDCTAIDGRDPKCWGYDEYRFRPRPLGLTPEPPRVEQSGGSDPEIPLDGIVNAASFMNRILAAGGIARGSIFSIFGQNLGPAAGVSVTAFPLGTELGGVSIRVFTLDAEFQAIPLFVFAGQINAIMPSNVPLGYAAVEVTFNGKGGNVAPVRIIPAGVGIFTATGQGIGPGSVTNFVSQANQPFNDVSRPAAPGQVVTAWLTGLGGIAGSDARRPIDVGAVVDVQDRINLEILVGSRRVSKILYAGRSPEFSGLDQIVFAVPQDVELGCYTPVIIFTNGIPSNGVTMATARDGAACPMIENPLAVPTGSGVTGTINFMRVAGSSREDLDSPFLDFAADIASASFVENAAAPAGFNPLFSLPPLGTCMAGAGLDSDSSVEDSEIQESSMVDAGSRITIRRSDGTGGDISLEDNTAFLGGGIPGVEEAAPLFFRADTYRLESDGGARVGPIGLDVTLPEPIQWTNRGELETVASGDGFEVRWRGGSAGQVVIVSGNSENGIERVSASFVCTADAAAGSLRVPAAVLANFPAGRVHEDGGIFVYSLGRLAEIQAAGLSSGSVNFFFIHYRLSLFDPADVAQPPPGPNPPPPGPNPPPPGPNPPPPGPNPPPDPNPPPPDPNPPPSDPPPADSTFEIRSVDFDPSMVSFGDDVQLGGGFRDTQRQGREFDLRWSLSRRSDFDSGSVTDIWLEASQNIREGLFNKSLGVSLGGSVPDTLPPGDYFVFLDALLDGGNTRAVGRADGMVTVLGDPRTVDTGATVLLDTVSPRTLSPGETLRVRWSFTAKTAEVADRVDGRRVNVEVLFIPDLQQNPQYSRILGNTGDSGLSMDPVDDVTFTGELEAKFHTYAAAGSIGHIAVRVRPRVGPASITVPTTSNAVEVQAR